MVKTTKLIEGNHWSHHSTDSLIPFCHECSTITWSEGGGGYGCLRALAAPHLPTRGRYHTNMEPLCAFRQQTKSPDKSAAWADLFTHKYQQADQSRATCDLRGSSAAIIIYRCGPAALMMEGAEGALTPNRLICCQTTNTTFDVVWFLLTEVVSLPVVADYSGSNYTFCSSSQKPKYGLCYKTLYIHFGSRKWCSWLSVTILCRGSLALCQIFVRLAVTIIQKGGWNSSHRSNKCRQAQTKTTTITF